MKGSLASDTVAKPLSQHANVVGRSSADNSTRVAHMASPRVLANVCKTCAPELNVCKLIVNKFCECNMQRMKGTLASDSAAKPLS